MSRTVGTSILDDVSWNVSVGGSTVANTWATLGFWNAYLSGAPALYAPPVITAPASGGIKATWNTTSMTGAQGMSKGLATAVSGTRYRISATILVSDDGPPVKMYVSGGGMNAVSRYTTTTGEPVTIELEQVATSAGAIIVYIGTGLNGYGGSVTLLDITIISGGSDVSSYVLDGVQISYGRSAYLSSTSPASARFQINYDGLATMPAPGESVTISANTSGTYSRRFTGTIAAVDYRHPAVTITATSILSDLNRRTWGKFTFWHDTHYLRDEVHFQLSLSDYIVL
jgi:hypothetical protein